jgi:hypothetical protein
MCVRRQVLCKMWPIQLASLCDIFCRCSFPPWLHVILCVMCNVCLHNYAAYKCLKWLHHSAMAWPGKCLKKFFSYQVSEHNAVLRTTCGLWATGSADLVYGVTVSCVGAHVNTCYHLVQKLLSYCLLSECIQITTNQYSQYGCEMLV